MLMDPGMVTGPVFCPWRSHRPTSREGDGGAIVSLSAWEQQALDSIRDGLAGSDPGLAALLVGFTRLADGEEMPAREKVRTGSRRALRRLQCARWRARLHRASLRLGFRRPALLLWLLTTVVLIAAVAVAVNVGGGHTTCPETAVMICTGPTPGHSRVPCTTRIPTRCLGNQR